MRIAALGAVALGILWLALWATGPATHHRDPAGPVEDAQAFAARIGGARAGNVSVTPALSIAVVPAGVQAASAAPPLPVRHDREAARAVWGRSAEFAPPE